MNKFSFKTFLPHIIAVVIFLVIATIYCKPALEGQVVAQHDIQGWRGMAQQSFEFKEKHGYFPLWTNSMFSGMPAYQIALDGRTDIKLNFFHSILTLGLPKPISFFFLACLGFYFLCIVARANPWAGIMGAIAYAYSTFDPIIVAVGHDTQMISLGYAPFVIGSILLLFQRKYWTGFALTALFSCLLIMQSHLQIVYYTLIIAAILTVAFFIKSYREKQVTAVVKAAMLALIAGILGLASMAVSMMPTYEYAKESMRGGRSQLTLGDTNVKTKGGLDKDYAFRYSLGFMETFTFVVPGLYGGSNGGDEYTTSSKFVQKFSELGMPEEQALQYENSYSYWGDQPVTSGPVYLGAIVCLLFIFGLFYVKGWYKWWIVGASIAGVILAYGSNLQAVNYFLFDYLPFYNKFRAPTMALVIPQLCFPLLGVLAISKLVNRYADDAPEILKSVKNTAIAAGAVIVLMVGFYMTASFSGKSDATLRDNIQQSLLGQPGGEVAPQMLQQAQGISAEIISALQSDRRSLMGSDLMRTVIIMALGLGLIYFFTKRKISSTILLGGLIVITGYDLLGVATRYLNESNYVDEAQFESVFLPTEADNRIKSDPDHDNFRVFNQTVDVFNDASTSYHHNSVGGYHPAKLDLYNDLITWQLSKGNMEVFNMLNTRYFIMPNPQTGKPVAQYNPGAFGNAWLVNDIKWVETPDEEMLALDSTDLRNVAVIENIYKDQVKQAPVPDSNASISLVENLNDKIEYQFKSSTPQVAVFSEIYYPHGWHAFIDGKKADYFKADYLLRAMYIPAGEHKIEFKFEPASYYTGRSISIAVSLIIFALLILAIVMNVKSKDKLV